MLLQRELRELIKKQEEEEEEKEAGFASLFHDNYIVYVCPLHLQQLLTFAAFSFEPN